MATPMIRANFENITNLGLALRTVFLDQVQFNDPLWSLAGVFDSNRAAERSQGMGGFGDVPEYTGVINYDAMEQLYRTTFEHRQYALGMAVERQLIDDDEYSVMAGRATNLGLAFDRTATKHLAGILNNAFDSTVAGGDGVELCGDHPYSPSNSSTQSNAGTSALTHDAVVATRKLMMQFEDSQGNPANVMPDTLVVSVDNLDEAQVIAQSALRSDNANNNINSVAGLNVVSSLYLTDSNNWFMVDSQLARQHMQWYWRVRPEFQEDPTSDYNLVMRYRGYMRYSYGWDHWRWIYGHQVTGA